MADYSKGIIYTIRSKDNIYVGSTLNLRTRKWSHKSNIYNENSPTYNRKLYKIIRENNYEWNMQPYKEYPCETKLQLRIEEERIHQFLKADMNSQSCGTGCSTEKERNKQYYDQHKDEIEKYKKQWYEEHKDENKEYYKQYYEENKNEINEKRKQKVTCECGCLVTRSALSKHRKTKKHINLIAKLNQ